MIFEPKTFVKMTLQTISEPRKVARDLFDLGLARDTLWTMLLLVLILNAALGVMSRVLFPGSFQEIQGVFSSPLLLGLIEAGFLFSLVGAIFWIGKVFGGQGRLEESIITVVWMEMVFLALQILTIILTLFMPVVAVLIMVTSTVLFFWIISHFTVESHQFKSTGLVFVAIVIFMIIAIFALSFLLLFLGVQPTPIAIPAPN